MQPLHLKGLWYVVMINTVICMGFVKKKIHDDVATFNRLMLEYLKNVFRSVGLKKGARKSRGSMPERETRSSRKKTRWRPELRWKMQLRNVDKYCARSTRRT